MTERERESERNAKPTKVCSVNGDFGAEHHVFSIESISRTIFYLTERENVTCIYGVPVDVRPCAYHHRLTLVKRKTEPVILAHECFSGRKVYAVNAMYIYMLLYIYTYIQRYVFFFAKSNRFARDTRKCDANDSLVTPGNVIFSRVPLTLGTHRLETVRYFACFVSAPGG